VLGRLSGKGWGVGIISLLFIPSLLIFLLFSPCCTSPPASPAFLEVGDISECNLVEVNSPVWAVTGAVIRLKERMMTGEE
jgi:hypothetical protein